MESECTRKKRVRSLGLAVCKHVCKQLDGLCVLRTLWWVGVFSVCACPCQRTGLYEQGQHRSLSDHDLRQPGICTISSFLVPSFEFQGKTVDVQGSFCEGTGRDHYPLTCSLAWQHHLVPSTLISLLVMDRPYICT
jgi:hypothetical protein